MDLTDRQTIAIPRGAYAPKKGSENFWLKSWPRAIHLEQKIRDLFRVTPFRKKIIILRGNYIFFVAT